MLRFDDNKVEATLASGDILRATYTDLAIVHSGSRKIAELQSANERQAVLINELASERDAERIKRQQYEDELQAAAKVLQESIPIGLVKAIGLLEVAEATRQLASDASLAREKIEEAAENLAAATNNLPPSLQESKDAFF